jgi:hypothetical protein
MCQSKRERSQECNDIIGSGFPDLDSKDSEGEKTGNDITGTDIESQNQQTEAQALVSFKIYMPPPLIYF